MNNFKIIFYSLFFLILFHFHSNAQTNSLLKVVKWEKGNNSLTVTTKNGQLVFIPYLNKTIQIKFGSPVNIPELKNYGVVNSPQRIEFKVTDTKNAIELKTAFYSLSIDKSNSSISFYDQKGKKVVEEFPGANRSAITNKQLVIKDNFQLTADEALYGLGQYRDGYLNLRGKTRELVQFNTQVSVPVILSTNGWGMFWDNASRTIFKDDTSGMSFQSDEGNGTNFFLFFGDKLDTILQQYRKLTGDAPLMPKWALGYHQSRNRYTSQQEAISVVKRMRDEKIPMNSIFIDYFFWGKYGMGSHHFDEASFPQPKQMMDSFHQYNSKAIVTIWPGFESKTNNYKIMKDAGCLLGGGTAIFNGATIYDPFDPKAAALYWKLANDSLGDKGIDGWFLDGPEPDITETFLKTKTYLGPATQVRNLYSLYHSSNFYKGLLKAHPDKRPYIITRSGWASQQHYGTVVWSGDIQTTFKELKNQITAGLNFTASGIPYWTTDVGGYEGGDPESEAYRELYVRWWQYGTFCPIFRSHGYRKRGDVGELPNELWAYGENVQKICTQYDELRYRLMPYVYSLAANIANKQYTPMRLLSFDFENDKNVYDIKDEFMYGPAFLAAPVTDSGMRSRDVYLPKGTEWIDFWSGEKLGGGQTIHAAAPVERIPVYVHAGSIVPLGPAMQYVDEKATDTIELRIYPGADGKFSLYEDEGDGFNYKKGMFSTIDIVWNNKEKTLTIGKRSGSFKGMLLSRKFNIVLVDKNMGTGVHNDAYTRTVNYTGTQVAIAF
ncbi:glycoside hydrolase family 31 protein [Ferruginibacter albus]|uniref:glycoside hydrolase family 31 protein n=1 Tax=Ferruginibacter albus TaxID=2875540 RepID=UPI001CC5D7E5|nr:TIM-barrel domain-containing protein [Ferruginibacter albus]UAY50854.1 DUF5110 domain-containing protein [Ferruginibacter albus]